MPEQIRRWNIGPGSAGAAAPGARGGQGVSTASPPLLPCPPTMTISGLPAGSVADQIAQNVATAQNESATLLKEATSVSSGDPLGVSAASLYVTWMADWLIGQFSNNGPWDYKRNTGVTSQNPGNYQQVKDFGNFNFGAVRRASV